MKYSRATYKKKYDLDAARMIAKTWNQHKLLKGKYDKDYLYSLFLSKGIATSNYYDLIVDENDKLVGVLTSAPTRIKVNVKEIGTFIKLGWNLLMGKFGHRRHAIKAVRGGFKGLDEVLKDRKLYDREVTLFFVDEDCRGQGLGKELMDTYMAHCKENGVKKIILMTDLDCNYGFYDYYGFKRVNEIHCEYFAQPEKGNNGFAYAYEL